MNPSHRSRATRAPADSNAMEAEFIRLLSQRFGDGLVYMAEDTDPEILRQAMESGLVSTDGHITAAGYRALKRGTRD